MAKYIFFVFITIVTMNISGQTFIPLWQDEIPFNKKGVNIAEINENHRISKVSVPGLYHYGAKNTENINKPAIVIVPGGGYSRQAFDHEGIMVAEWFSQRGYEAFILKYRLPDDEIVENPWLVPLCDGQQAIYYLKNNSEKFNINTQQIGIIGFSAGGHLAASVSTLFNSPVIDSLNSDGVRPSFSILIYPVISMDDAITHKGSKENLLGKNPSSEMVNKFSLELQTSVNTPVTFIIHAIDDKSVVAQNSSIYAENLYKNGGDVTKIILPTGGHGFGYRDSSPVAYWTLYLETWLNSRIKQ
jgi:acetyl esterase/lipase